MIEIEGLAIPCVGVLGCEVVEADAEVEFELGGFVGGGDSEVCEEGHGFWVLGAGKKVERISYWVCVLEAFYWEGVMVVVRVGSGLLEEGGNETWAG